MPKRGLIFPKGKSMETHERPMTPDEVEEIEKLRACLLSAHDLARLLEWRVNHLPSHSLDRTTCERVCKALWDHAKDAAP